MSAREKYLKEYGKKYRGEHRDQRRETAQRRNEMIKQAMQRCREKYGVHWRAEVRKMFGFKETMEIDA